MINQYFLEVFGYVPRQGPGSKAETERAWSSLSELPQNPAILDIGCGKGAQTMDLCGLTEGHILALDNYPLFLEALQKRAQTEKLSHKITCFIGDMGALPFLPNQFDIIWAEGSMFIIGYKKALREWKNYLKRGGFLVFTDCVWLKENAPNELLDFWQSEGIELPTVRDILDTARKEAYETVSNFTIHTDSWIKEFYDPIEKALAHFRKLYPDNVEAIETFNAIQHEIDIYRTYHAYFGYEFFVLKKL
ncbi:MAG: class I SAM-dependent methyltransferase [Bacteroidota bacterium]|nr:MAG: class I SAM-dependent methyltransferase [Bacteroidota bacterium]